MAQLEKAPPVSPELVEWLERLFPLRPARIDMRHRAIWMEAGNQQVIQKLRHQCDFQTKPQEDTDEE